MSTYLARRHNPHNRLGRLRHHRRHKIRSKQPIPSPRHNRTLVHHPPPPYTPTDPSFQMDCIIAGLLPYPPNILVLSYTSLSPPSTPSSSEVDFRRRTATRPELRIVSPDSEELSSDALSLKDYVRLQPGDYSLQWNEKRKCVYIVSPSDIVVGRERTAEDRVQWLLDRGKYREALEVFESSSSGGNVPVGKWTRKEIGVKYIEHLIEQGSPHQL